MRNHTPSGHQQDESQTKDKKDKIISFEGKDVKSMEEIRFSQTVSRPDSIYLSRRQLYYSFSSL